MTDLRCLATALLCGALSGGCRSPAPPLAAAPPPRMEAVAVAPALPLTEARSLQKYVDVQLDNFFAKRADRMGRALEPDENGLIARTYSTRLRREFPPIEAHFNAGEELFEFEFRLKDGLGDGEEGRPPNMHRVHRGAHGGPDTTSCRSCHHRGGDDGAGEYPEAALTGGDGQNTFHSNERNAPPLLGGGAVQILAREITEALQEQLRPMPGKVSEREITYQGVSFGTVRILPDGKLDTGKVTAIDPDFVVRPFGWKGTHATLRRFAEEAFQVHHGMQSQVLIERRELYGTLPLGASPATLAIARAMGKGPPNDPDQDGVRGELLGTHLTSISVYLALLPLPVIEPPKAPDLAAAFHDGEAAFREAGCPSCHKPTWMIKSPTWRELGETETSPDDLVLDLRKDIQRGPQLDNLDTMHYGQYPIFLYSDLRRHDMGPELADTWSGPEGAQVHKGDRQGPSIPPSYFLTRPLWGLADSAPYLHDGRAATIPEAILAHGGEAQAAREAFKKLPPARQRALHVFLLSLTRPPVPEVVP